MNYVEVTLLPLPESVQCNGLNTIIISKEFFSPLLVPVVTVWSSNTFLSPYSLVSRNHTDNSVVSTPFYTSMWAEPMVKHLCSRRGDHEMYIASVTPYIPGVDGTKNSLVGACEYFTINRFSPRI